MHGIITDINFIFIIVSPKSHQNLTNTHQILTEFRSEKTSRYATDIPSRTKAMANLRRNIVTSNQLTTDLNKLPQQPSINSQQFRTYLTVGLFSERNQAFTESALRNLIFKADSRKSTLGVINGNGLIESRAIVRLGRKVLINEEKFFEWLEAQQSIGGN